MTPEAKVKAQIKKVLDELGAYYFLPATHGYGRSGVPDICGCLAGVFFGIEAKAGKGKTTALQERELAKIHNAGGIDLIVNEESVGNLKAILEEELQRRK
jgi:hypothetical protein